MREWQKLKSRDRIRGHIRIEKSLPKVAGAQPKLFQIQATQEAERTDGVSDVIEVFLVVIVQDRLAAQRRQTHAEHAQTDSVDQQPEEFEANIAVRRVASEDNELVAERRTRSEPLSWRERATVHDDQYALGC